jgi:hypothetical protein
MAWSLAPHVSYCIAAGEVIFLDTARDRYFRLPSTRTESFLGWTQSGAQEPLPDELASLETGGLLCAAPSPGVFRAVRRDSPAREIAASRDWRSGRGHILDTLASYRVAWWRLRQGLQPALDRILPPVRATGSSEDLAARFLWLRGKLPRRPKCLLDSLAMTEFLHAQNAEATLVFGIHAQPFAAHCWVEHRGVVLNDSADAVQSFTPILVR